MSTPSRAVLLLVRNLSIDVEVGRKLIIIVDYECLTFDSEVGYFGCFERDYRYKLSVEYCRKIHWKLIKLL